MGGKRIVLAACLVALAEVGFLSWVIAGRAAILRSGKEVLLKVEPIDPRDLLRGDYVRLGYQIGQIPVSMIENAPSGEFVTGEGEIFVRLGHEADGYWRPLSASLSKPPATPAEAGAVDLRGTIAGGWTVGRDGSVSATYGIERYYVPEGEGRAIEEGMRERSFGVLVAVSDDGTPQIKALLDGERILFEEPLY